MNKKLLGDIKAFIAHRKGQGIIEYGLIIVLIAVAVTLALGALGQAVADLFGSFSL